MEENVIDEEVLNASEVEENKNRLDMLTRLVRSKQAVLFIGAGCSVRLGYPNWRGLLTELESILGSEFIIDEEKKRMKEHSPLEYADIIRDNARNCNNGSDDRYHQKLHKIFSPKPKSYDDLHEMLINLDFKGIVTTNYDTAIESCYAARDLSVKPVVISNDYKGFVSEFFLSLDHNGFTKGILHVHGTWERASEIVLTSSDYRKAYGLEYAQIIQDPKSFRKLSPSLYQKVLWALLATKRLVFIGFSFDDPYFKIVLASNARDLWRFDLPIHFAVLPISSKSRETDKENALKLKSDCGIETIFYIKQDKHDDNHIGLYKTVCEIATQCGISVGEDPTDKWHKKISGLYDNSKK